MQRWVLAGVLAGVASSLHPALAEVPAETIAVVAGPWEFSGGTGDARCPVQLTAEPGTHGFGFTADASCAAPFPVLADVAGWTLLPESDGLRLLDARGAPVLDFVQEEGGLYGSPGPDGLMAYSLVNLDAADFAPLEPSPEQLAGDWTLAADDDPFSPRCRLVLDLAPEAGERHPLRLPDTCPGWIAALAIDGWRLQDGGIALLSGPTEVARLVMEDPVTWRGLAPSGQTLVLTLYLPVE